MSKKINLIDTNFGKNNENLVIKETEKREGGSIVYKCLCGNCGNTDWELSARRIKFDNPISCGCLDNKVIGSTKHGMTGTRFYRIWRKMNDRCYSNDVMHLSYKERGIIVCDKWRNFQNFMGDMYEKYKTACKEHGEKNVSIDRVDPSGNYEPSNCRWATSIVQSYNKDWTNRGGNKPILCTRISDSHKIITYNANEFSRAIFGKKNNHITDVCRGVRTSCKGWVFKFISRDEYYDFKKSGYDFVESYKNSRVSIETKNIPLVKNEYASKESYLKSVLYYYINRENKIVYGSKSKIHKELGFVSVSSMNTNLYRTKTKKVRKLTNEEVELHIQGYKIYFG